MRDCTFGFCGSAEEYFLAASPANEFPGQSDPGQAAFTDEGTEDGVWYQYLDLGAKHLSLSEDAWACCVIGRRWATPEIDAQELAPVRMCSSLCLMRLGVSTVLCASGFDVSNSLISSV